MEMTMTDDLAEQEPIEAAAESEIIYRGPTPLLRRLVALLRKHEVPVKEIAEAFGCGHMKVREHYRKEFQDYPVPDHRMDPHVPTDMTRRVVEEMASYGAQHEKIMAVIGVGSHNTLKKHYQRELELGMINAERGLVRSLHYQAVGGPNRDWEKARLGATIALLRFRHGWKEAPMEVTTPDGRPFQLEEVSPRDVILSRIAGIAERLRAAQGHGGPDGGPVIEPGMGLELLGAPGADDPEGELD
jgi:hypothetical protein